MSPVGFLDIVKRKHGEEYDGDEFGGARGTDGSGLPTGHSGNFMFATGIECSYPTIDNGRVRRDELAECGHYERWREDLALNCHFTSRISLVLSPSDTRGCGTTHRSTRST